MRGVTRILIVTVGNVIVNPVQYVFLKEERHVTELRFKICQAEI